MGTDWPGVAKTAVTEIVNETPIIKSLKSLHLATGATASSFYSTFTQLLKTFNSTLALQVAFLKRLGT